MMKRSEIEALEARGVCVPTYGEAEAEMAEAMETMVQDGPFACAKNDPWAMDNTTPVDMPW